MLFVCSVCALSFETHSDLQSHIKTCCNADYGSVEYGPEAGLSLLSLLATAQRKHEGEMPPSATAKESPDTLNTLASTTACLSSTAQCTDRSSGYLRRKWDTRANGFEKWRLVDGNNGSTPCTGSSSNKKQEGNGKRSKRAGQPPPKAKYAVDRVLVPAGSSGANDSGYLYSKFSFKTILRPKKSAKGSEEEDTSNPDPSSDGTFVFKKFYATKGKPDVVNSIVSQSYQWPQINTFQSRPGEHSAQRYPLLAPKSKPNIGCDVNCAQSTTTLLPPTSQEVNMSFPVGHGVVATSCLGPGQSSGNKSSCPILPQSGDMPDSKSTSKWQQCGTIPNYCKSENSPGALHEVEREREGDTSETNAELGRASHCGHLRNLCSKKHLHVSDKSSPPKTAPLGKMEVNEGIIRSEDNSDRSKPDEVVTLPRTEEQGIMRPTPLGGDQGGRSSFKGSSPDVLPGNVKERVGDPEPPDKASICLLTASTGLQLATTLGSEAALDDTVLSLCASLVEKQNSEERAKFETEKKVSRETIEGKELNELFSDYQDLVSFTNIHRRKGPMLVETLHKLDSAFFSPPTLQVQVERYLYMHRIVGQTSCDKCEKEFQHLSTNKSSVLGGYAYELSTTENAMSITGDRSQTDEREKDSSCIPPIGSVLAELTISQRETKIVENHNISRKDAKCQTDFVASYRRNEADISRTKILQRSVACQTCPEVLCCDPNCKLVSKPMKGSLADVRSQAMQGCYSLSSCHSKCRFGRTKRSCSPTTPSVDSTQRFFGTLNEVYDFESRFTRTFLHSKEGHTNLIEPLNDKAFDTDRGRIVQETIQKNACNIGATKVVTCETPDDVSLRHLNVIPSLSEGRCTEQCGDIISRQKLDSNRVQGSGISQTVNRDCNHLKSQLTKDFSYCAKCCVLSDFKSESSKAFEDVEVEKPKDFERDEGKKISLPKNPGFGNEVLSPRSEQKPSKEARISCEEGNQEEAVSGKDGPIFFCKICCLVYSSRKDYDCHLKEQSKCRISTSSNTDTDDQNQAFNNFGNSDGTIYGGKECPGCCSSTTKRPDFGTSEDAIQAASALEQGLVKVAGCNEITSRVGNRPTGRNGAPDLCSTTCCCSVNRHKQRERGTGTCDFKVRNRTAQEEEVSLRCSGLISKEGSEAYETSENTIHHGATCTVATFLGDSLAPNPATFAQHPNRKRSSSWRDSPSDCKRRVTVQGPRRHSMSHTVVSIENKQLCKEKSKFCISQSLDSADVLRPEENSRESAVPCGTKSLSRLQKFVKENSRPSQNFWRCANCQFLFTTRTEYIDHMLNCACGSDFKTPGRQLREILMHRRAGRSRHHSSGQVEDSASVGTDDQSTQLREHRGSGVNSEVQEMDKCARIEPFVRCSQCSVIFTSFKELDSHCCDSAEILNL